MLLSMFLSLAHLCCFLLLIYPAHPCCSLAFIYVPLKFFHLVINILVNNPPPSHDASGIEPKFSMLNHAVGTKQLLRL